MSDIEADILASDDHALLITDHIYPCGLVSVTVQVFQEKHALYAMKRTSQEAFWGNGCRGGLSVAVWVTIAEGDCILLEGSEFVLILDLIETRINYVLHCADIFSVA